MIIPKVTQLNITNTSPITDNSVDGTKKNLIDKDNARQILGEINKKPIHQSTYHERLCCMQADPSITSWQALTRDPATLDQLKENETLRWSSPQRFDHSMDTLAEALAKNGVWIPELDNINTNIMQNLTVQLNEYLPDPEVFKSILQKTAPTSLHDVSIIRGPPSSGKSSFLEGQLALSADSIKNLIQRRMPGVAMMQVHDQAVALLQRFTNVMESRLYQSLSRDAMYLWPKDFGSKIESTKSLNNDQKINFHDIQVDLTTLCCRILKRGPQEATMNFGSLSTFFKASIENRNESIKNVIENKDRIKEYSLIAWDKGQYITIAEYASESKELIIRNQEKYNHCTQYDSAAMQEELERVKDTVINQDFIQKFIQPSYSDEDKTAFLTALNTYMGKTIKEALDLHANRTSFNNTHPNFRTYM